MQNLNNNKAFTLVELLVVVAVIGILAGVSISLVNPQRQQDIAQDGVNKSTIAKLAEGIEAYYFSINASTYPSDIFPGGDPIPYIKITPSDTAPGLVYTRFNSNTVFCLCIPSLVTPTTFFKYCSSQGKVFDSTTNCSSME